MNKRIGILASAIGLSFLGTVGTALAAVSWSSAVNVTKISSESATSGTGAGKVYMMFSSNPHPSHSCSNTTGLWQVQGSADSIKATLQIATAAKLAGKSVKVLFNDSYAAGTNDSCSNNGTSGYPVVRGLDMQ